MVDSRAKGRKAETNARDKLRELTGHKWERIPSSGALDPVHGLKGDLYIPPAENNRFCVEVKHYKDDQFTSKLLSSKSPIFLDWWEQAERQARQVEKEPLLIFKYDRSKWFVAYMAWNEDSIMHIENSLSFNTKYKIIEVALLTDLCDTAEESLWLKQSTN